jgi:hypothetical protein
MLHEEVLRLCARAFCRRALSCPPLFFCHAPLDGASPLNEVNEKAPVYDRGFLKCVTPRSAAHS